VLYGIAIVLFLFLLIGIFAPVPETNKKEWAANGIGDKYDIELKCEDPSASIWKVTISVKLTEKGTSDIADFINVAILHYTGEPSALDEGWHIYKNTMNYTEGAYAEAILVGVELDPSEVYRIGVETDPELGWTLEAMEEWR
jgi:hypothetical protein